MFTKVAWIAHSYLFGISLYLVPNWNLVPYEKQLPLQAIVFVTKQQLSFGFEDALLLEGQEPKNILFTSSIKGMQNGC